MKELDLKLTLRIMGRGSVVQISARPKVTIAQTSRLFIGIVYIAAVVSQTPDQKKNRQYTASIASSSL